MEVHLYLPYFAKKVPEEGRNLSAYERVLERMKKMPQVSVTLHEALPS